MRCYKSNKPHHSIQIWQAGLSMDKTLVFSHSLSLKIDKNIYSLIGHQIPCYLHIQTFSLLKWRSQLNRKKHIDGNLLTNAQGQNTKNRSKWCHGFIQIIQFFNSLDMGCQQKKLWYCPLGGGGQKRKKRKKNFSWYF